MMNRERSVSLIIHVRNLGSQPYTVCMSLLLVVALFMTSCAPAATKTPLATEASAVTKAAEHEKTLVMVSPSLAQRVDPCSGLIGPSSEIVVNIHGYWTIPSTAVGADGKMRDNTAAGEEGMRPGVFESWEASEDGKVWTMHLRHDIVDSFGNQLKAGDAKWIFDRMISSPECSYVTSAVNLTNTNQIEAIDDYTLRFTLPASSPVFLRVLHVINGMAFGAATVRQHATADDPWAKEWMKTNAAAIGPYMIESWTPGQEMVLVRNPNYYGDPPKIGRIVYREVPEAANRVALVVNGDAHIARDLTQEQLDTVDQAEGAQRICVPASTFEYLALNTQKGPTAERKVRQALAYAVSYNDILNTVYRGQARALLSFVPGDVEYALPPEENLYHYDLERAKALLTEAGYPDGFNLELLISDRVPEHERIAVLIKDSFSKIGVNLEINRQPHSVYVDRAYAHDVQAVIGQDYSYVQDVSYHANLWLYNGPPPNDNFAEYANPEFNKLQQEVSAMPAGAERGEKLIQMQRIFIEDSPWIFLDNPPTCYGMRDNVTGYIWHIANQIVFDDLDITE